MSGNQLKDLLKTTGLSLNEIGRRLGMSSQLINQALSVADVKTGFLEKLCTALGVDMTFFYPTAAGTTIVNANRNSGSENIVTGNVGGNVTATTGASEEALLLLLKQNQQILDMLNKK